MKRIVLISLLGAFLFQALSGLVVLAVFHLNRDYISDNLCINRFDAIPICKGSCYLEKQLSENEQQQQDAPDLKSKGGILFYDNRKIDIIRPVSVEGTGLVCFVPRDTALLEGAVSVLLKPPIPIS